MKEGKTDGMQPVAEAAAADAVLMVVYNTRYIKENTDIKGGEMFTQEGGEGTGTVCQHYRKIMSCKQIGNASYREEIQ